MKFPNQKTVVLVVSVLVITAVTAYAVSQLAHVQGQASVFQGGGAGSDLGNQIQGLAQGIIGRTQQQVQNTLEQAGQTQLSQLQANASQYECVVTIMHFGKVTGAMTCSENASNALSLSSTGGGSVQSSITSSGGATSMQNQIQGSGSSANVIPGDVP